MTTSIALRRAALALALGAAAGTACAHTGHDAGSLAGFASALAHPFGGLDHLLAMLAVGAWAAVALPRRTRLAAPLLFVGAMLAGALVAAAGLVEGGAWLEAAVAASVVALGVLLAGGARVAAPVGLVLVAAAALPHGAAHGLEAGVALGSGFAVALAGFAVATAVLHGIGLVAGAWLARLRAALPGAAGALVALVGAAMLAARI